MAELEALEDVTIVIAPDLWFGTEEQAKLNARAMAAHCAKMRNRMTVLHLQEGLGDRAALELTPLITEDDSAKFSALYYPWLEVFDNAGEKMYVPPVGHVAGMWARVDGKRGVHKAPANEVLQGVLDLEKNLMDEEQAELNEKGLNCIRSFRGQGIRVWGARTQVDSSDVDWRYINVRRLCNFIQESIRVSSRWAIFEPNDERLWSSLRGNVSVFLRDQWRAGALAGATPSDAYYVICDETNNDPTSIAAGEVYCDIGIAAVRPGEFITFRVTQIVGGPES
ncbi:phage tail sheath family protein [Streptomyces sp. WZ-12]|uniref:phage tail sheath family protein n=1 Tax=Streptomyces sp. WZ-12 TaxID=3030210 RepID=UPI0023818AEA|nr:phage tail sheath C-terminal domain-containing protein [Streptomyces sp. WZ-12]